MRIVAEWFYYKTHRILWTRNDLLITIECCLSYWSLEAVAISKINEIDVRSKGARIGGGGGEWVRSLSSIELEAKVIRALRLVWHFLPRWDGNSIRTKERTLHRPGASKWVKMFAFFTFSFFSFFPHSFLDGFQRTTWPIDSKSLNLLSFPRSCNDFTTQSSASLMHWSIQFFIQGFQSFTLKERLQPRRENAGWKKRDRKTYFNLSIKDNATSAVLEIYV